MLPPTADSRHTFNLPVYYEYKADGITSTDAKSKGTYLDNYKQILTHITDATCEP